MRSPCATTREQPPLATAGPIKEEPTEVGLALFEDVKEAYTAWYAVDWGYTQEQMLKEFEGYELSELKIANDSPDLLDTSVNASVYEREGFSGVRFPCYALRAVWEHPYKQRMFVHIYVPVHNDNFNELCAYLGIPENDLAQFNFTSDEIKAFDEEACDYLAGALKNSLGFAGADHLVDFDSMER